MLPVLVACDAASIDPEGSSVPAEDVEVLPDPPEQLPGGAVEDATRLYDPLFVHTVTLTLSDAAVDTLRATPDTWVEGDLVVDGKVLPQVGVRVKGSASFQPVDQKPSWKIETDQFVDGQRLWGVERLTLNNEVWDPTMMAESMAYQLFRETGAPAPRTSYAQVTLNDRLLGVYAVIEAMDDAWVAHSWPGEAGSLWESTVGCDFPRAASCLELQQAGDVDDTDVLRLVDATIGESGAAAVSTFFHPERVPAFLAAEQAVNHPDSYSWNLNNFYVYHDPSTGTLSLSPWGADSTFTYAYPVDSPNPDCEPLYLDVDHTPPEGWLRGACATVPACAAAVSAQLEVVADWMESADLVGRMGEAAAVLDPYAPEEVWVNWTLADRDARVACFQTWAGRRPDELRALAAAALKGG